MKLLTDIYNSFNTSEGGFSGRKLSAFAGVVTGSILSMKHTTPDNVSMVLGIWLAFALLCLGIITAEQVIKFKNGGNDAAD